MPTEIVTTRRDRRPRTYLVVKDPKSGKSTGLTIRGMTAPEVLKRLHETFNPPATNAAA